MSNKLLIRGGCGFETITSVLAEEAAKTALGDTTRNDVLHEHLLRLACRTESPGDEDCDDAMPETDHARMHAFEAPHVHPHSDDVGGMHPPALSLAAVPAKAAGGPRVEPMSGDAHPGPHADLCSDAPRREGRTEIGELPLGMASPATWDTAHALSRTAMLSATPRHAVHDVASMPSGAAAPAKPARGPHVEALSGNAPGAHADISSGQEGGKGTTRPPMRVASPATQDTAQRLSRNALPGAKPQHAVHDAASVPPLAAALAEPAHGPHIEALSGSAHPGPHADISSGGPRREGRDETGKPQLRVALPATRDTPHDLSRNAMPDATPQHALHDAASVPSWTAASAETVRPSQVESMSGNAHPGARAEVSSGQEGSHAAGKPPFHLVSAGAQDLPRSATQAAMPPHAVHDAYGGYSRVRNASVALDVIATRAGAPYNASFATYCLAMNRYAVGAQAAAEAKDRFDHALIDDQAADALIGVVGPQRRRTGRKPRRAVVGTPFQPEGSGEDRVQGVAPSASSRLQGSAAARGPVLRAAPARTRPAADSVQAHGEAAPWRLRYTFRSWHGTPSIELTQKPAASDAPGCEGGVMVAITAGTNQAGAAAEREIACALARGDAPAELTDATIAPVQADSA